MPLIEVLAGKPTHPCEAYLPESAVPYIVQDSIRTCPEVVWSWNWTRTETRYFFDFLDFFLFLAMYPPFEMLLEYSPDPYRIKLYFNHLPESLNRQLRTHFYVRKKMNDLWDAEVAAALLGKHPREPLTVVRICIERVCKRFMDYDGCVASMKPVVDALVSCRILEDDSYKNTGSWIVRQIKGEPGLYVEVSEVTP